MSNRTLLLVAVVLIGAWLLMRGKVDTATLYGTGPRPVIGGHYGGGQ